MAFCFLICYPERKKKPNILNKIFHFSQRKSSTVNRGTHLAITNELCWLLSEDIKRLSFSECKALTHIRQSFLFSLNHLVLSNHNTHFKMDLRAVFCSKTDSFGKVLVIEENLHFAISRCLNPAKSTIIFIRLLHYNFNDNFRF